MNCFPNLRRIFFFFFSLISINISLYIRKCFNDTIFLDIDLFVTSLLIDIRLKTLIILTQLLTVGMKQNEEKKTHTRIETCCYSSFFFFSSIITIVKCPFQQSIYKIVFTGCERKKKNSFMMIKSDFPHLSNSSFLFFFDKCQTYR